MTAPRSALLRLMPGPTAPGQARDCVREFLTTCALAPLLDDAMLLVSELVTNAVRHGRGMVTLAIESDGSTLGVSVADDEQRLPRVCGPSEDSLDGRGMCLVDELAGAWGSRASDVGDGKAVWFRLP